MSSIHKGRAMNPALVLFVGLAVPAALPAAVTALHAGRGLPADPS